MSAFAAPSSGITFTAEDVYETSAALSAVPHTFEAEVYFPASYDSSARGGVIIGNYPGSASSCINFEIYTSGRLRYYWIDEKGDDCAAYFDVNA